MTEKWQDPCTQALNNVNQRIYNARGNHRLAGSDEIREDHESGGRAEEGALAAIAERDKTIRALESENKRLAEQVLRLERLLARDKIIAERKEEGGKTLSDVVPAEGSVS